MHEAFYEKYDGIFCTCANSVYQTSPREGGGGGAVDKANSDDAISLKLLYLRIMHDKAGCVQT